MKLRLFIAACVLGLSGIHLADVVTLESDGLGVAVDSEFPRIIKYESKSSGEFIAGQTSRVDAVELNGKVEPCRIAFKKLGKDSAEYRLNFMRAGIAVRLLVTVGSDNVEMRVTKVRERGDERLMSFSFPGNCLLSIDSREPGASIAATVSTNLGSHVAVSREVIKPIAAMEPSSDTGNYLFMSTGKLACGIASNDVVDIMRTAWEVSEEENIKTCRAWRPRWQYREIESETVGYPWVKVFVTGDRNGDGEANWQDGAIVYRAVMPKPFGNEYVRSSVGCQVAMNFASGAQQPFIRILDNIKKIYLATDGIGQEVLIKGFSAEGHDSANTDYGGHYNERAGGLKDLNFLLERAKDYNSRVGIHINASEVYPEAHRYKPEILLKDDNGNLKGGWVWLDRAILIDKRKDILTGNLFPALEEMRREMPELDYVYVDTYWENGWKAWKLAKKLNGMGLPMYTEGHNPLDPWTTWAHWRGGKISEVMRFIWYSDRDLYGNDAILRTGVHTGFMGWQNESNFHTYIRGVFTKNLPAKYLQNFELLRFEGGKGAEFSGGVKVTKVGDNVSVSRDGRTVMTWTGGGSNSRLFVPWDPINEKKIYLWDEVGEQKKWELPRSWEDFREVYLYKLTDIGRTEETKLAVVDGKVTIKAVKATPYVVYPGKAPKHETLAWGEGGFVKDPGFDSHGFEFWDVDKSWSDVTITNDGRGNSLLAINESDAVSVSQEIGGLEPGKTYAASVWVLVKGERKASINVLPLWGGEAGPVSNYVTRCNVRHGMPNDPRKGSNYQRLKVVFDMPEGCSKVVLSLKAANGETGRTVEFDDVRIVETKRSPEAGKHWFYEDFENVDMGYGPFTCCFGERTHLSETNKPYTKDTINGRFSFKTRDGGRVVRTLPATIRFKPWTRYKLVCETLASSGGSGRITVESRGRVVLNQKVSQGRSTVEAEFVTTGSDESFMSIFKDTGEFLVIDDIAIDEMGSVAESERVEVEMDDKPLADREVLLEDKFDGPLAKGWKVFKSRQPGTRVVIDDKSLLISGGANVSAFIERKLPAGVSAVECCFEVVSDQGETWGPGVVLLWENGNAVRINIRSANMQFGIDTVPGGQSILGNCGEGRIELRIKLENDAVCLESRSLQTQLWEELKSLPRDSFDGFPDRIRIGKTHAATGSGDHTSPGSVGDTIVDNVRFYGDKQ